MAEAIVSLLFKQLCSIAAKEVKLVVGVEKEVNKLKSYLKDNQVKLIGADIKQVKDDAVRERLDKIKDACYDMEDVLDDWNTAVMKLQIQGGHDDQNDLACLAHLANLVCSLFDSSCIAIKEVVLRHNIAVTIKKINENLDEIAPERDSYNLIQAIEKPGQKPKSTSFIDVSDICGRDDERNTLISKLLCESSEEQSDLHIISLVGLGGIGKTTLAQFAYNDDEVKNNFDEKMWVCVSDSFEESRIAKAIIEDLTDSASNLEEFNSLMKKISNSIGGKKFLLVLDDVWTVDDGKWQPFYHCLKNGCHGSKILVTTRNENVAAKMRSDIIPVKKLSEEECWLLFKKIAFWGRSRDQCAKLEEIGRNIARKCDGLPLAAKTIGCFLQLKQTRQQWQDTLDSEIWGLEDVTKGLLPSLLFSYNDLPLMVKHCFLYCSIFPKGHRIVKDRLIKLWMAQGYLYLENNEKMEIIGEEYFDHLATRSFFQNFYTRFIYEYSCRMHDTMHDFAQFMSNNECLAVEVCDGKDPFRNSSRKKVRHLMLTFKQGDSFPKSIYNLKKLRSLLIGHIDFECLQSNDVLSELFGKLTNLRAFDISSVFMQKNSIAEIPKEIEKLVHLRYLNLEKKNIEKLPEALCELYNLQTLNIKCCGRLKELPQGLGKLINLRHLMNFSTKSISHMPIGIKSLTCLFELQEFVVSVVGDDDSKAAPLVCLKDFNDIRGYLRIRGLENVTNVGEFKGIQVLENKKNLRELSLQFGKPGERERSSEDEFVLQTLQPPLNLEKLWIESYKANTFPSNLMTSLTQLTHLYLRSCSNCENLSPLALGKLPSLKSLEITEMKRLKRVDNGFWGIQSEVTSSSSLLIFPTLKQLKFSKLREWEEWDGGIARQGEDTEIKNVTFMPFLASLRIEKCPKLKVLPDSLLQRTTLEKLLITGSPILMERYKCKDGMWKEGKDWHKISHIPDIQLNTKKFKRGKRYLEVSRQRPGPSTHKPQA